MRCQNDILLVLIRPDFIAISLFTCEQNGLYVEHLLDNYVTGFPVLICAALEAVGIGWIYGTSRIKEDIKLMSGKSPNLYWVLCFAILTPIATISGFVLALIANQEITLNGYHYPLWAHSIGWTIVIIILAPLVIFFHLNLSKYNLRTVICFFFRRKAYSGSFRWTNTSLKFNKMCMEL